MGSDKKHRKAEKRIPFDFVLERLDGLNPVIRPMFGCHAVYIGARIVVILRKKDGSENDNGVWLATTRTYHESLRDDFPSLRPIEILGGENSEWQVIPSDAPDFEEGVMKLCDLILRNDPRIGKIPKTRNSPQKKRKS